MLMMDTHIFVKYFYEGLKFQSIKDIVRKEHNICVSVRQMKRIFSKLGLWHRKNHTGIDIVVDFIKDELSKSESMHGYKGMHRKLLSEGLT